MNDIVIDRSDATTRALPAAGPAIGPGGARVLNLAGLVSPVANLGMTRTAPADLRWFGVGAGVVLCGGAAVAWRGGHETAAAILVAAHYALVLTGLLNPHIPEAVGRAWTSFGHALGKVMSYPIFAALYFLVLTPTALLVRLFSGDPLKRRAPRAESYWVDRKASPRERFERQF